jgi:AAA+ ATPase superfamily predicted ATPase
MPKPEPMQAFIGRKQELAALARQYKSSRSGLVPVYGRRRVGKTELLLQFAHGKPTIYFSAREKLRTSQLADFLRAAAEWLGAPHLAGVAPPDWEAAFHLALEAAPRDRKLVLILDEFQWLCDSSPEIPSVLQKLWDLAWQRDNRILLILCGSFIGFMEREVLGSKSPLHGRRTGDLRIEPFPFREAADFFPRWSREEQARAYFVCGGVPAYLRRFDPNRSVTQNVAQEFFALDAFFQREPDFLLREELSEVKQATSILETIARGRRNQGEIARGVGLSSAALAPHLKNLLALGYLERVFPLKPTPPAHTSVLYRLADPVLRFWFRFIEPSWSQVRRYSPERGFEQLVAPQWESYCGECFERLCREALPLLYSDEGVAGRFSVGEYWDKTVQIDVVGLRADNWIDLAECKWHGTPGIPAPAAELAMKVSSYPSGNRTVRKRLFVRAKPRASATADVTVHELSELYGA